MRILRIRMEREKFLKCGSGKFLKGPGRLEMKKNEIDFGHIIYIYSDRAR